MLINSVKKATSASSLKAMRRRDVRLLELTLFGGVTVGREPCAANWICVKSEDGRDMLGKPFGENRNGTAAANVAHPTTAARRVFARILFKRKYCSFEI